MDDLINRAKKLIEPERKREWYEEVEESVCQLCPALTYEQRITGCLICIVTGFVLSMGSLFRLVELLKGDPMPFAVMYTIGNIIGISASCFLYGPWSQLKKMFAATRFVTTIVYLTMMGMTLFLAFYPDDIPFRMGLLVLAIFVQFLALAWYTLSFIPFGRDLVRNCCLNTCCQCNMCKDNSWQDFGNDFGGV
mmetsp:Transcript_11402/g.18558  ORF Transcript_11402/g.18558 Transcript_11402/m.18558 type:complete len:193 (+) Transcript_11402:126-704(+)